MASEDVIELGSSDDDAEPTIKKLKPTPNAMVHIPTFHGVTIKPAKSNASSAIPKELAGNVTVTKISKGVTNPYANKKKSNGKLILAKPILPIPVQQKQIPQKSMPASIQVSKTPIVLKSLNPLSIIKNVKSQVVINKVPSAPKVLKNTIKVQSPRTINNLPSSITVTRTAGGQKRVAPVKVVNTVCKKQKIKSIPKTTLGEVLTVVLDDDELSTPSTTNPQWYLRPEEQSTSLEVQNNKEPDPKFGKEMIEITIEDSPIKPVKDKRTCEITSEFTVTIDDSPVKTTVEKNTASGSDGEAKTEKVPHSKKKLEYPKEAEVATNVVEIEISPIVAEGSLGAINMFEQAPVKEIDNVIEIEESPLKVQGQGTSTPKKEHPIPSLAVPDSIKKLQYVQEVQVTDDLSEFHPVYQSFIKLCFELENSEDMKKIVEKKIKTYYRQVPKEYTESEEFTDMVAGKVLSMKAGPEKMYLYIKDIVDELNLQRKMAKSQVLMSLNEKKNSQGEKYYYGTDSEYDSKRQRQIRKLEKTLKKLHRAIQKLEDQEVDFDDEEDSVYLLTESDEGSTSNKDSGRQVEKDSKVLLQRYKERMVRVHAKFCQLTNTKMPSEPRVQIDARPGQASGPAKRLEKWINKKVPIGTPLPFPDFHDVLRCVREANDEDKLGWNEADIMEQARDLFTRCGKKLQRRRQENEWRIAASRISADVDPADKSQDLLKKLDDNKKIAANRETEVFQKYADRQTLLKLEAEEIGDKEAEESPADDDEEEELQKSDEKSLENKEKRKERLKRLLHDKSKKMVEATQKDNGDEVVNKEDSETKDKKGDLTESQKDSEIVQQKDTNNDKDLENKQNDTETAKKSENKDELIKTTDSDKIKIVSNKKNESSEVTYAENEKIIEREVISAKPIVDVEKAHSISDDSSNKLESDVDELHLLQKLHSENENNTSTLESSDSETPIAISDTLGSSSDNKKRRSSDVISIENSSYSESETKTKDTSDSKDTYSKTNKVIEETVDADVELECSNIGIEKKQARSNNDEYNESVEDILLASTDDEVENDKKLKIVTEEESVNLKDDTISIGDTVVEGKQDASSVESMVCVSLKDDSPGNSNMETEQGIENVTGIPKNNKEDERNRKVKSFDKNEQTNSIKDNSENSVESVNMIEVKESSPEEDMEVIEESTNSQDSENKETVTDEVTDNVKQNVNSLNKKAELNPIEKKINAPSESANTIDEKEKENSPEVIIDAIDKSMKSLNSETAANQSISNKL